MTTGGLTTENDQVLISDEHRFIFIHIPKTAGSSITQVLSPHSRQPTDYWMNRLLARCGVRTNLLAPPRHRWFRRHTTARRLRPWLPAAVYDSYFKFAFVRNPWDWLVSYYHFVLERPRHRRHGQIRQLGSFAEFLRYECSRRTFLQSRFVTDARGRLIVDYVGRFEHLEADFQRICDRAGLDATLVRRNQSRHQDYRDYYDRRTIDLVAQGYRRDIELFGYAFDGVMGPVGRV